MVILKFSEDRVISSFYINDKMWRNFEFSVFKKKNFFFFFFFFFLLLLFVFFLFLELSHHLYT